MIRPKRRASHKPSMAADADESLDDAISSNSQETNSQQKMTNEQEDILISLILKHFDVIENKTTDKSLSQSNKKAATEAWKSIQSELEKQAKVCHAHFC